MWEPIPPVGYCALGTVVVGGVEQPLPVRKKEAACCMCAWATAKGLWMALGWIPCPACCTSWWWTLQKRDRLLHAADVDVLQQGALTDLE